MASTGPLDKVRDLINSRLKDVLATLRTQNTPETLLLDNRLMDINAVHPMLYADELKPWQPTRTLSDEIVADFEYPVLPFTAPDNEYPELQQRLITHTEALIADIGYYQTKEWTKQYKSLLSEYMTARSRWLTEERMFEYTQAYALSTQGKVSALLAYFNAWLPEIYLGEQETVSWADFVVELRAAKTTTDVVKVVTGYITSQIIIANQQDYPISEIPMATTVKGFGIAIDTFINSRPFEVNAIAYSGAVSRTYGIQLLSNESENLSKYNHIVSKALPQLGASVTIDQRKKTLYVLTGRVSLDVLWNAAQKNLPTLVFVLED